MGDIVVKPVQTKAEKKIFLEFPWRIYQNDPVWVPPLLPERANQIDPDKGVFFKRGKAEFFIAWYGKEPVGTICAADDTLTNQQRGKHECVFGFFEYLNDFAVFEALLQKAIEWARQHGLDSFMGPFNLDYEDGYGVLLEGRDRPPTLMCGHSPEYYAGFMDRYGMTPARGDNLAFAFDISTGDETLANLARMAERVRERKNFIVRPADLSHWEDEIVHVQGLLNIALAHLPNFIPWQPEVVEESLKPFKDIVDPELILFAEADGKTVAWFPGIPNLNEAFIHANGLRKPWDYLSLLYYMKKQPKCLAVKSILVLPEYWGSGLAILLFHEMAQRAKAKGYQWVDLSLTSDDNPKTPQLATRLGARLYKRYRIYEYSFPK